MTSDQSSIPDEPFLSTGEFAQLCQVKKQTLFHYDAIDLLKPIHVSDNGYRQYSYRQYEDYIVIASLKEVGMSLGEIDSFLKEPSSTKRLITISKVQAKLDAKIEYLSLVRRVLEDEMNRARVALTLDTTNISLEESPEQHLIRSQTLESLQDDELVRAVTHFASYVEVVCAAFRIEDVKAGDCTRCSFLLAREIEGVNRPLLKKSLDTPLFIPYLRPKGRYVVAYHKGNYEEAEQTYAKIFAYFTDNKLKPAAYAYEEYLRNELTAASPNDYLTKISIPLAE